MIQFNEIFNQSATTSSSTKTSKISYASIQHLLFNNRHGTNGKENDASQEEDEEVDKDKKVKIVVVSTKHLVQ